ncbi:RHS repeat domain-containing protein [Chitinimonas lacunae]|uniref:RHS repeat domain-containing protein n=1 Tax=Chitinimonas lacunae TaxID=1963018 RepID=A0ABV8MQ36_9NEIS
MATSTIEGKTWTYRYAANGERVQKIGPDGKISIFVYSPAGELIGEYDANGKAKEEIIWFANRPVASIRAGKVYYVMTDHLSTPRQLIDSTIKQVVWSWEQDEPFGASAADAYTDKIKVTFNLRFPGQYYDAETGKNYNYFRDYDPSTGRYIQSDPIGLRGGLNTYSYGFNNPLSNIDPFGLEVIFTKDGVEFHGNPRPAGGSNYGEHTTQVDGKTAYHVHINDHPNKRWDVTNNRPLDPEGNFTKKELKVCKNLSDNEQKYLRRAAREVFHHRPDRLPKLRTRYLTTLGAIFGVLMSDSYQETCSADVGNQLDETCNPN